MCIRDRSSSDSNNSNNDRGDRDFNTNDAGGEIGGEVSSTVNVGSDSGLLSPNGNAKQPGLLCPDIYPVSNFLFFFSMYLICLLYTSDAADDLTRVDLGGRRIIKKKKKLKQ